jgi:hypothetical protein
MTDAPTIDATLYITDAELIRRMGVPEKIARQTIRALDATPAAASPGKRKSGGIDGTGRQFGPTWTERAGVQWNPQPTDEAPMAEAPVSKTRRA